MKMGKIKGSKKQSKEMRKENLPYYGKRRANVGHSSSATVPTSDNSMAESSDDDSHAFSPVSEPSSSSASSWNLGASSNIIVYEEDGITPLPAKDEADEHISVSGALVSQTEPNAFKSSVSAYHTCSLPSQHVTPAVQRKDVSVNAIPMAPRVLGNSQRENCPVKNQTLDQTSIFFGMLTPPRKADLRSSHHGPKGPDYFEAVSEEIILHVFTFLSKASLARCMRVCKKWYRVANDESLWRRIDLAEKLIKPKTLGQLIKRGTTHLRLARADIFGNKIKDLYSRLEEELRLSRLQYLDLSMATVSKDMLVDIFTHCRQLCKVSLENIPVNDTVFYLLSENKNLDTLNMAMCHGVTSSGLMPLFAHCKLLTQLNLAWTGMKRSSVSYVCGAVPDTVRLLNLSGCREAISDNDVELLVTRCTNLLELDLSDSLRLTEQTVVSIRCNLPELRRLSLSRCYSIPPSSIGMLGRLPKLQALNVMGMLAKEPGEELQAMLPKILVNKIPFSTVARPTTGHRRTSIWEQRVRESV